MNVLCICGSPHVSGVSDLLIDEVVKGVRAAGGLPEAIFVRDLNIIPCKGCHSCENEGKCSIEGDDMKMIYEKLSTVKRIVVVSPVYFYSVPAVFKILIDRCQVFWARKYKLNIKSDTKKYGAAVFVAGAKDKRMFKGIERTIKYFFDVLDAKFVKKLNVAGIDAVEKISGDHKTLFKAFELGKFIAEV